PGGGIAAERGSRPDHGPGRREPLLRRGGRPHAHRPRRDRAPGRPLGRDRRDRRGGDPGNAARSALGADRPAAREREAQPADRGGDRAPVPGPGPRAGGGRSMTDTQLDTLEAKGLIKLAALRPELEYLFRHALVQDAAYGSLLKQERRELHGRVGEALEELFPDRRDEVAPVLAMHFEQAGERDRAIEYFVEAAEHALRQNAIHESFGAYDRAATLLEEGAKAAASAAGPGSDQDRAKRRR